MKPPTSLQERRQQEREQDAPRTHQISATGNVAIVEDTPTPWRYLQTINTATWGHDPNLAIGLWAWAGFNGFKLPTCSWD